MISFQKTLTPTKYPGYYWDVESKKLYSFKIGGVLKEMKLLKLPYFLKRNVYFKNMYVGQKYYRLSHKGRTVYLTYDYLEKLKIKDYTITI